MTFSPTLVEDPLNPESSFPMPLDAPLLHQFTFLSENIIEELYCKARRQHRGEFVSNSHCLNWRGPFVRPSHGVINQPNVTILSMESTFFKDASHLSACLSVMLTHCFMHVEGIWSPIPSMSDLSDHRMHNILPQIPL